MDFHSRRLVFLRVFAWRVSLYTIIITDFNDCPWFWWLKPQSNQWLEKSQVEPIIGGSINSTNVRHMELFFLKSLGFPSHHGFNTNMWCFSVEWFEYLNSRKASYVFVALQSPFLARKTKNVPLAPFHITYHHLSVAAKELSKSNLYIYARPSPQKDMALMAPWHFDIHMKISWIHGCSYPKTVGVLNHRQICGLCTYLHSWHVGFMQSCYVSIYLLI